MNQRDAREETSIDSVSNPPKLHPETCPSLRTKTMYLNTEHRRDADEPGNSGTAVFWCLETMAPIGPDDFPVDPKTCLRGRTCCSLGPQA